MLTARQICIVASLIGAFGVMAGAFGSHYLDERLAAGEIETFQTGIRYLQIHSLLMLFSGFAALKWGVARFRQAATFCLVGIILFSGSLIVLALTGLSWLGALAPVGGLALIASWIMLSLAFARLSPIREAD